MNKVAYRKGYRVRLFGKGGYEITVPKIIIERAAMSKDLTIEEFIKTHKVVHLFNNFTSFDAAYRFEPAMESGQEILEISEEELEELSSPVVVKQPEKDQGNMNDFDRMKKMLRRCRK